MSTDSIYNNSHFIWVEKYRPKTIDETILPADLKTTFQQFVDKGNISNLILSGSAGVGKTTVARAMLEQLGCDYIIINGSIKGNIDTLRNEIHNFASTVSLSGGRKYVILDEADYLNANSTQPALRNFMEEFSKNCGFILTCNYKNRIIEPLHSRCSVVDFKITKKDMAKLAMQFMKRVGNILEAENIEYDKAVIAEVIQKHFPDWRRVLNELQRYSVTGKIDSGILANIQETSIRELVDFMKDKNFTEVRKWIRNNLDADVDILYNQFYDYASHYFTTQCVPMLIVHIATYQYQNAFSANQEINFAAFCAHVMLELEFV
jgi:DNA polymerase III delta prime subunit